MPTIQDGRQAVDEGNLQQARLIFEAILQETPRSEDAWLGLAEVLPDTEDKRICYDNVLKIDKDNRAAREGLRNLEPQANPFIAALQGATVPGEADETELYEDAEGDEDDVPEPSDKGGDRPTMIGSRADLEAAMASSTTPGGPPSYALVALGLILSVVVFAVGGSAVYFVLSSLAGG